MEKCFECGMPVAENEAGYDSRRCAKHFEIAAAEKNERRNRQRRMIHQGMLDLGLVRVRGALGGVYYE